MEFKDYFKENRQKFKKSQRTIAEDLKVSQSLVAQWERGKCTPNFNTLQDIADYFQTDINKLLGYIPNNTNYKNYNFEKIMEQLGIKDMNDEQYKKWIESATILAKGILNK